MNINELQQFKKELGIADDKIIREEAEMIFLDKLAESSIGDKVIFYGGTALRLAYNSPRYSEDIDLIQRKKIIFADFKKFIYKTADDVKGWKVKDIKDKRNTIFALLLVEDEKLKHPFYVKIEIHKPEKKINFETKLSLIKSPVSILSPLLLVPTLEELKTMKENAIANRIKPRDVFDLWYISQVLRENFEMPEKYPKFKRMEFKNELQVFLPKKYYKAIDQLYAKANPKN